MSDSLKKAREAIDQIDAQCIYCDGRGITRDRKVPCNGSLHKVSKEARAALDAAVEEARAQYRDAYETAIGGELERNREALSAERERGRREVIDMLYTVAGQTFRGDALAAFQNCIADAVNLLPPEKGEEKCPRCGKSGPEARQVHTCMKVRP